MAAPSGAPLRQAWPRGASLDECDVQALHRACHAFDPHSKLGCHRLIHDSSKLVVRVWNPRLEHDWEAEGKQVLLRPGRPDAGDAEEVAIPMVRRCAWLYEAVVDSLPGLVEEESYDMHCKARYRIEVPDGGPELIDAYAFAGELMLEEEVDQYQGGCCPAIGDVMGSHIITVDGVVGLRFVVWAPRANAVSVVGDWNSWDGRASQMRRRLCHRGRGFTGIWELFVPFGLTRDTVPAGSNYGYHINTLSGGNIVKNDPFAQEFEAPPTDVSTAPHQNASKVASCDDAYRPDPFPWSDAAWLQDRIDHRMRGTIMEQPMAIYEVHLPSWRRTPEGGFLNYRDIAPLLVEHMKNLHFNYVELIGLAHHPYVGSWGYQVSGYYGCYSLLGSPDDFKFLVNKLHEAGIGVLMDFVPAHFCKDPCSFAGFDGTACYEYEDPREGEQKDWGTKVFCFRRNEVCSFLIGSAMFWAHRYHIDGFRCDAISSMIYRNFCTRNHFKPDGEWVPNEHGGNDNLEAVAFLRNMNKAMHAAFPGVIMIAEESHAWGGVTAEEDEHPGWLGFDLKWDLGWMNDTLEYFKQPSCNRHREHIKLTGRELRIERWVVPLSHDEVANEKGSLLEKMGKYEDAGFYDRIRNLALLYGYQVASIGRPLLFMGNEIGQGREWNFRQSVDWHEGEEPLRAQLCTWVSDLLGVYLHHKPLHAGDDGRGIGKTNTFEWVESNAGACVLAFARGFRRERPMLCISNFSNQVHRNYGMSVPYYGEYEVLLNSDDPRYGGRGCGPGNMTRLHTSHGGCEGWADSLWLDIPAQSCLLLLGPHNPLESKSGGVKRVDLTGQAWLTHGKIEVRETAEDAYIGDDAWLGC